MKNKYFTHLNSKYFTPKSFFSHLTTHKSSIFARLYIRKSICHKSSDIAESYGSAGLTNLSLRMGLYFAVALRKSAGDIIMKQLSTNLYKMKMFKNSSVLMMLLAGAFAFTSCSSDDDNEETTTRPEIKFTASQAEYNTDGTRTELGADKVTPMWSKNDELQLFAEDGTHNFHLQGENDNAAEKATFKFANEDDANSFANCLDYHRFQYAISFHGPTVTDYNEKTGFMFSFPENKIVGEKLKRNNIDNATDLLASEYIDAACISTYGYNELRFKRFSSVLKIKIKGATDEDQKYLEQKNFNSGIMGTGDKSDIRYGNGKYNFGGDCYFSNAGGVMKVERVDNAGSQIRFKSDYGTYFYNMAEDDCFYVNVLPTKLKKGDKFYIDLMATDRSFMLKEIECKGDVEFKSGFMHEITITVSSANGDFQIQ